MKLIIIGGKARNGKSTTADFMKEYLESKEKTVVKTSLAKYIKMYAKDITGYNEEVDEKPRELLQALSKEIRAVDELFLLKRIEDDFKIYENHAEYCIIDDIRLSIEVDYLKESNNAYSIKIVRPNFDNGLTEEQKKHNTETGLDGYEGFDKIIENDGTLENLKEKAIKVLEEI